MKQVAGIILMMGALGAPSAFAQEQALAGFEMPRETSADAGGTPEWYRQFSFTSDAGTEVLLSPGPAENWGLSWNQGARWSINIDRTVREGSEALLPFSREELSAGAMFRLTPRLSVGGELSVGGDALSSETLSRSDVEEVDAGIRLRSAFKF